MPKTVITSGRLSDKLVGVVDKVRRVIHGKLGTRPWAVDIVIRRWSGDERGVGSYRDTIITLDPTPMVKRNSKDRLGPAGREPTGSVVLTGVSLMYSLDELQPKVDARTEVAYRLRGLHGEGLHNRFFVLAADPISRWGDKEGDGTDWYLVLNETSPLSNVEMVDAP